MTGAVVTVQYLDAALSSLRDGLRGEMRAMEARIQDEFRRELGTVVSHFANVMLEQMRAMIAPLDEKLSHYARECAAHRADESIHRKVRPARPRPRRT